MKCSQCGAKNAPGTTACAICQAALQAPRLISTDAWQKQQRRNETFGRRLSAIATALAPSDASPTTRI